MQSVLHTDADKNGHFVCTVINIHNIFLIAINIYGYNTVNGNNNLLTEVENRILHWLSKYPNAHLLVGGDFNISLENTVDRWPPGPQSNTSAALKSLMQRFDLIDIWREHFPTDIMFTWSNASRSRQSRIDFWLISSNLKSSTKTEILPTPLTDHKGIRIDISLLPSSNSPRSSYWKMNSSVLSHTCVKARVKELIQIFWNEAVIEGRYRVKWELFKFEVGQFFRGYCSSLAKAKRTEEENIIARITTLSSICPDKLTTEDKETLLDYQGKIDNLYKAKAEGAFVRSRRRWLEEGEQNSAYFFRLEKSQSVYNTIEQLRIGDTVCDDAKLIANFCSNFYKKLYSSQYCEESANSFLDSVSVNQISKTDKELGDCPVTVEEIIDAIKSLKVNKSPGVDGITSEFYKAFCKELAPFLLQVFNESISNGTLPPTLTQGLITLLPKPKKDHLIIENWRPITLLNNDYKILAIVLAKRIKSTLHDIIDETQSGFMENRHISNNIRLVLDILDYPDYIPNDSFILFLDFYKAFDSIEHEFIFKTLKKFGFGDFFCKAIRTLYGNGNSSIKLKNGSSPRFEQKCGIRQGCPISPYLFLLCTQLLANHIKNSGLKGMSVLDREIIISQLADDTTLFLNDATQVSAALDVIQVFSSASGLHLNVNKCELMAVKECNAVSISNIPVKEQVTYLGIVITKDQNLRCSINFNPIIDKTKKKFNMWLQRDLSVKGRTLLSKAEGISRLTYAAIALDVDTKTCKSIDQLLLNFIWKNRTHYVKKSVMMNDYNKGGLNVIDFSTLHNTFKVNWIKNHLKEPASIWNFISSHVFSQLGGLKFILLCNYNIDRLPVSLSNFHKQALLSWSIIYKHNFSPNNYFIWNNRDICYKKKSIFFDNWFRNGIVAVNQLLNEQGNLFNYREFLECVKIPVTPKQFAIVFDAIPLGVIMLLKGCSYVAPQLDPLQTYVGKTCLMSNTCNNNRTVRNLFLKDIVSVPCAISAWSGHAIDICWTKAWTLPNKFLLVNKVKEVSFKIIHRIYPVKSVLAKFSNDIETHCTFCNTDTETLIHFFWFCDFSREFWRRFCCFIIDHIHEQFQLRLQNVFFGFTNYSEELEEEYFLINLFIILAKYNFHKCKFNKTRPSFVYFLKDVDFYFKTICAAPNKKAIKTVNLCKKFKIVY